MERGMLLRNLESKLKNVRWLDIDNSDEIDLAFNEDFLIQTLNGMVDTSWGRDILDYETIIKWLNNFTGQIYSQPYERILALILAVHMVYYNENDICHLVKLAHRKLLHIIMEREGIELRDVAESIVFLPLGTVSESGPFLSYYYRKENCLPTEFFVSSLEDTARMERVKNIVLMDDVSISGGQVDWYIKRMKKKSPFYEQILKEKNLYALFLMATITAKEKLKQHDVSLCTPIMMDQRSRCFDEDSSIYKIFDKNIRDTVRRHSENIARYYGCKLLVRQYIRNGEFQRILNKETDEDKITELVIQKVQNDALGYDNAQMLIAFEYNTPNNTLPIIWADDEQWSPLFKRYDKLYSRHVLGGMENENVYI